MLDVFFICGQVLCLMGCLYGAYLVIRHSDIFRAEARVLRKIREGSRDGMTSLDSSVSGEGALMTGGTWSPSRAGFFPGATAETTRGRRVFLPPPLAQGAGRT